MTGPAIGIDLGTTYSLVAHINSAGRPEVIRSPEGEASVPSVAYCGEDPPLVGKAAKELQAGGETEVAAFFKRNMGDSQFMLHMGGRDWSPVDLSALVLRALKENAEAALGTQVSSAVVTVPAYFHNQQREATIEAGRRAGLEVRKIINEPTAAALAYGLHAAGQQGRVIVYDLGGGTFDVSLVEMTPHDIGVMATAGDHNLGGKDWDDRIASYLAERFAAVHGVNPLDDNVAFHELLTRAEAAKKALTVRDSVPVVVQHGGHRETLELTRATLEDLTRGLMERTQRLVEQALEDASQRWSDLAGVLLVGGSTRMRMVHEYVTQMSGKPPMSGVNVDEAVALGAAIQAGLELEAQGPQPRLGLPSAQRPAPKFFLAGRRTVHDVTAHSLGVIAESADRNRFVNSVIVARNTTVPAVGEREYQVPVRQGNSIECTVYVTEGERDDPRMVAMRGKYVCVGTARATERMAKIRIKYAYDRNSTIQVHASEAASGAEMSVSAKDVGDLVWLSKSPRELQDFDPSSLRMLVSPSGFDDIGAILRGLGLKYTDYTKAEQPLDCDILFLNCGSSVFPSADKLRAFVEQGGSVYASDLMDTLIASAFGGRIDFAGHVGDAGTVSADVSDPDLQEVLGKRIQVTFDMGIWAVINSTAPDVHVLLRSRQTGNPLMVMASHGNGTVFYTCFHNHSQTSETEQKLLRILILKQISVVSGVPIELVASSKGLGVR